MAITEQKITDNFALYNGDCIEAMADIPDEAMHLSIYSPPFAELYNYSSSPRDLSNCASYDEFMEHYRYVVEEIYRLTMPGRITIVHCMDLKKGSGLRDFPGDIIRLHEDIGFYYHSRTAVWKEPLRVAIRTRSKGLMHRQIVKDSIECNNAGADYILAFHKGGKNPLPVTHNSGLTEYAGARVIPQGLVNKYKDWKDPKTNKMSHWIWQQYASSFWDDIRGGNVLPYRKAKEKDEEKHVCPLQLDIIERCIDLWSNPGEKVFTPFMGVGSEVFCAVKKGRKGVGVELKPSYYRQAMKNIDEALKQQGTLL